MIRINPAISGEQHDKQEKKLPHMQKFQYA
jgi:hypothetical protein